jgi:acyl-CoA synthetase (NDP forming)/GNAT superfamily N-acetyltransferase
MSDVADTPCAVLVGEASPVGGITIAQTRPAPAAEALLADGRVVQLRMLRPEDYEAVRALHARASDDSVRLRFFSLRRDLALTYAEHLAGATNHHLAMVAVAGQTVIGVASAELNPADAECAEVAVLVDDARQHTGIATLLLEHLAAQARRHGIRRFVAEVLEDNVGMLDVLRRAGFRLSTEHECGVVEVTVDLELSGSLRRAVATRERAAEVASLRRVLAPRSVLVVGASRYRVGASRYGGVGRAVLDNLLAGGYSGRLAVVNSHARPVGTIAGVAAYRRVAEVPFAADLAVLAIPAAAVPEVVEECGQAGVAAVVVLSSGFAEASGVGADIERELVARAHRYGMRLVGPNCFGVLNTDPAVRLDATFGTARPLPGRIALASQSGALGISVLHAAAQRGLGISAFVSLGNKADVSGNDLLLAWADDPRTAVIALYLESIGNPRRFRRIAREVSRTRPVVVLRSGRSAPGARAGRSHTAAAAAPDAVLGALLADSGVIGVDSTAELLDVAALLECQPVPTGTRIAVLGNAGGPGALAADHAVAAGATVPALSSETVAAVRAAAPGAAAAGNPIDLGAAAPPRAYAETLRALRNSGEVDAVVVLHASTRAVDHAQVLSAVGSAAQRTGLPAAGALLGADPPTGTSVPWYEFGEQAVHALVRAGRLGRWRTATAGDDPTPLPFDPEPVQELLATAARCAQGWLEPAAAVRLLDLAGITHCPSEVVTGSAAAVAAARELGFPTVVKSAAPGLVHKTDVGAVAVGLADEGAVQVAAEQIIAATGSPALLVQPMVPAHLELAAGVVRAEGGLGLVMVAAGGVHQAVLDDRVLRTVPLGRQVPDQMLAQLRCAPLLAGHRGSPPLDTAAVAEVLARLGALVEHCPQIAELDLNPLRVSTHGAVAVDTAIRCGPPPADRTDPVADEATRAL